MTLASFSNPVRCSALVRSEEFSSLTATFRFSESWTASKTTPMPPPPSLRMRR
ncbi:MAG: hypothetical protein IJT50_11020 [Lentisphaeria bacterium]|nr:hypothetical protein [Lentisphaeria bacterium]